MANSLSIPEVSLAEIIAGVDGVAAQGTLTLDTQVATADTMVIGAVTYEFLTGATAANGKIGIGADLDACKLAVVAAINGTDGFNTANGTVVASAFVVNDCVLTAKVAGTGGNAIVTTSSFTTGTNLFDAVTLGTTTAGVTASVSVSGRIGPFSPLVVRVMGHDDDVALEEDDPDKMALFTSRAQGHPWCKEKHSLKRVQFIAADGSTPCASDATYIVPFLDYSTYE